MRYLDFFRLPMEGTAIVIVAQTIGAADLGVALTYLIGDRRSPATRALALSVAMVGLANASYPAQHVLHPDGRNIRWPVGQPIVDALVMIGLFLWMLRVTRAANEPLIEREGSAS